MQNMKVDIVYYTIPADFEMEFNLNGCCPMRLLKTLTYDKKEYVTGLARAVSRSKIIIVCGPVYGEDGLISMTARAIRKPLEIVDNREYGIAQDQNVKIIEGSVPLVTASGLFGGVIVESGPQTIIILSENKDIRKSVMHTLIHPYVREVSILEIRRNSGSSVLGRTPAESSTENAAETEEKPAEADAETQTGENDIAPQDTAQEYSAADFSQPDANDTVIDFSEETPASEGAPSDEAIGAVAKELNDLSSEIGRTLYANDNTQSEEQNEQRAVNEPGENTADEIQAAPDASNISNDDFLIENEDYEIERDVDYYSQPKPTDPEMVKITPQIDFTIDPSDDESDAGALPDAEETDKNQGGKTSDTEIPRFLFNDESALPNDTADDAADNISFIAGDDEPAAGANNKKQNKRLNISIIITAVVLAVILLLLAYFLIYVPKQNGISTEQYLSRLFSGSVKNNLLFL